jgi:8-oxo-dGTP pyrophosphatase MutT (NUDIX family)
LPPEGTAIVAAGLVRRGNRLLMVRQAGPGEDPFWSIPGGKVEPGELATEALVREVREETGITVLDPGALALTMQMDERYLRGELEPRSAWFRRVHPVGSEDLFEA